MNVFVKLLAEDSIASVLAAMSVAFVPMSVTLTAIASALVCMSVALVSIEVESKLKSAPVSTTGEVAVKPPARVSQVVPSHFHVRSPEVNSSPVDGASGKLIAMSILYQVAIGLKLGLQPLLDQGQLAYLVPLDGLQQLPLAAASSAMR